MKITGILNRILNTYNVLTTPENLSIPVSGGSFEINIICNTGWKIIDVPAYVNVSHVRGFLGKTIILTFPANENVDSLRSGTITIVNSFGKQSAINFTQDSNSVIWDYHLSPLQDVYEFSGAAQKIDLNCNSYKIASGSNQSIPVDFNLSSTADWIASEGHVLILKENPSSEERDAVVEIQQLESGIKNSINVKQLGSNERWEYFLSVNADTIDFPANATSKTLTINAYKRQYINDIQTSNIVQLDYIVNSAGDFISTTKDDKKLTVYALNNNTEISREASLEISLTEGNLSDVIYITQEAGRKIYSEIIASLVYPNVDAIGGVAIPELTYSQSYTWNGDTNTETQLNEFIISNYSINSQTFGTLDTTNGYFAWDNNKSTEIRTCGPISVTITGSGDKYKTLNATCTQSAGYHTYGDIIISDFSYEIISANGASVNPSLIYTQTYGWNGNTYDIGTITGNGDDDYSNYKVNTPGDAILDIKSGVVTWTDNIGSSGVGDSQDREIIIDVTVSRNGKTTSKTATSIQKGESIINSEIGDWTFSVQPDVTAVGPDGGTITMTITRPIRKIVNTYDSGDVETTIQTASSGSFNISNANSAFTLSTSTVNMTNSSLPTFNLSIGSASGSDVEKSTNVSVVFTASNPSNGNNTASVESVTISRANKFITGNDYRFSEFYVSDDNINAASQVVTLYMKTESRNIYNDGSVDDWVTIVPNENSIDISVNGDAEIKNILLGNTSTCDIYINSNYDKQSGRDISIVGSYNNILSDTLYVNQSKDEVLYNEYGEINVELTTDLIPASGGEIHSGHVSYSQYCTLKYVSGDSESVDDITTGAIIEYGQSVYADSLLNNETSEIIYIGDLYVTVSLNGKTGEASSPVYQDINQFNISYDVPYINGPTYAGVSPAGGSDCPIYSVSQTVTESYTSGYTNVYQNTEGDITFTKTSGFGTIDSNGCVTWDVNTDTTDKSCTVILSVVMNGRSNSASGTSIQVADYIVSATYGNVIAGSISNGLIYASGGSDTATAGAGSQTYVQEWASGKTTEGTATIAASPSSISGSANSKGVDISDKTVVKSQVVTWAGSGDKTVTKTMYIYQEANEVESIDDYGGDTTWYEVSSGDTYDAYIPASGGSATAEATSGTQDYYTTAVVREWCYTSGECESSEIESADSGTISISPNPSSLTESASSKGTDISGETVVGSTTVTWSGNGGKSATGSMTVYQEANTIEYAATSQPYTSYGNVSAGSISNDTIPCEGGSGTATAGDGSQIITITSGKTTTTYTSGAEKVTGGETSTETISISPSHSSITASAGSNYSGSVKTIKTQTVTWSGQGGESATDVMSINQVSCDAPTDICISAGYSGNEVWVDASEPTNCSVSATVRVWTINGDKEDLYFGIGSGETSSGSQSASDSIESADVISVNPSSNGNYTYSAC